MSLNLENFKINVDDVSEQDLESVGLSGLKIVGAQSEEMKAKMEEYEKEQQLKKEQPIVLEEVLGYTPSFAICIPGDNFSGTFLQTWTNTIATLIQKDVKFVLSNAHSNIIHFARSLCLGANTARGKNQKPFNGKLEYTHVLWIDPKVIHVADQILQLLFRKVDVVSAVYTIHDKKTTAVKDSKDSEFFKKNGHYNFISEDDIKDEKNLIEVDFCGLGFMLISRKAIESLEYPWFYSKPTNFYDDVWDINSEDVQFCLSLKEKGFKIFIDPTIKVGYEKTFIM